MLLAGMRCGPSFPVLVRSSPMIAVERCTAMWVFALVPTMVRKLRRLVGSLGSKLVLGSPVTAMVCGQLTTT